MKKTTIAYIILACLIAGAIVLVVIQNRKQKQQLEAYQQQLQAAEDYTRQNALATGIGNTLTSIFKIFK